MDIFSVLFPFMPLIYMLLILGSDGDRLLKEKRYHSFLRLMFRIAIIVLLYLLYITAKFIESPGFYPVFDSVIPLLITTWSIIFGIIILRKYFFVIILPWVMSSMLLLHLILLFFFECILNKSDFLLLNVLLYEQLPIDFFLSGVVCIVANFILATFFTFYFIFKKKTLLQTKKFKKNYFKLYSYISVLSSASFLFYWIQCNAMRERSLFHNKEGTKAYVLLLIVCIIVLFFVKIIVKRNYKFKNGIYIAVNILLIVYLMKKSSFQGMSWLLSYYVLSLIVCIFYEIKKIKGMVKLEEDNISKLEGFWGIFLSYCPLFVMLVSNLVIVACDRALMF